MRREIGFIAVASAVALACSGDGTSHARNVVLITIDTLRADAVGAYGSQSGATPHLDALAQRGVLFEQAHSSVPNTLPSHASILTGLHPFHHRVRENGVHTLADASVTLAERLKEAGYATGAEVAALVLARTTGIAQGFDRFVDTESAGVVLRKIRVAPDGALDDPSAVPAGGQEKIVDLHTRSAEEITRSGITFARAHAQAPFFLWLHYYDPHWPYTPPAPYAERFAKDRYAGGVAYTDHQVGAMLDELARLGLAKNTLVVIAADHGEGLGNHGESRHSYLVYQEAMRVPLVFAGPDVPQGRRVVGPVQTVDIAPTVLAWAGLPPNAASDGISLLPAFAGDALPERLVYGESASLRRLLDVSPLRFVREGRWKLIHKPIAELYDLDADPAETRNVAGAERDRAESLRTRLAALIATSPGVPAHTQAPLDDKTRQQLESLGYVVGGSTHDDPALDSIDVFGPDPSQVMPKVDPVVDALGGAQFSDAQQTVRLLTTLAREFPGSSAILELLLDAQLKAGDTEGALASLQLGTRIDPDHQRYWSNRGELLTRLGRDREAIAAIEAMLARWPCDLSGRTQLAGLYSRTSQRAKQIEVLEAGVAQCGSPPELVNDLAYQLATAPTAQLRNGARALALAESMLVSLGENPLALDTLAAAQAEVGRRDDARATLARAIAMAERQKLPNEALQLLRGHERKIAAGESIRE